MRALRFCPSSLRRLGHVRIWIAVGPSPLPTLIVPAWPVFPRPDSCRATPRPWQPSADACTNGRANIFPRLGDRSHPNPCSRYPEAATTARSAPACWWDGQKAARGHPSRSSPASAQAHSLRHLPLSGVSTIPCWRTCTRRLTRRIFSRSEEHTSELQSHLNLVCRLLLEKKKKLTHPILLRPPPAAHP